jgi:hypothetical protein
MSMLRLKLHMVLVIQITGNSTQASYHLIYLAISLGRKIRAELNREEGAAKITHSLKILLDQKVKVELDMKERIGMETHSLDMATQTKHDGQAFTAVSSNGAVVIQGNGAKSTLAVGATGTFAGQVIEVPSVGAAIVVDGAAASFTSPVGFGNDQSSNDPPTATFTESGQIFTAAVQGGSILLKAAGSTTTMAYGAQGTFAGQSVSMPPSPGNNVVKINDESFTLQGGSEKVDGKEAAVQTQLAAVVTQDGETFTAQLQGVSTVVLEAASTTLTMPPGAVVTLDGEIFSVPAGGSTLVHDGTTITLISTAITTQPSSTGVVTTHAGRFLSAFDLGSLVVVVANGNTITLADGSQTTIGYDTLSAASAGGAIVVNGTLTVVASTRTNVADPSTSDGSGAETTGDTGQDSEGVAASSGRSPVWMSILLLLGSWAVVVVMWL